MRQYLILLLLFVNLKIIAQNDVKFSVELISKEMGSTGNEFFQHKNATENFFEDNRYVVTTNCRGEFGGQVYFKEKSNSQVTFCEAICPLIINKLDDKYYLTTSLAHLSGSYGFYEISNPKDLAVHLSDTIHYRDWQKEIGLKPLVRDYGKTILLSFVFKSKIYHIVSGNDGTYVAERKNTELIKTQTITEYRMYSYTNDVRHTKENRYLAIFQANGKQGFIDVKNDQITVYTYTQ